MKPTTNLPLFVGIAMPVIFILVISAIVFLPSFFVRPQHNFIYINNDLNYNYSQRYTNTYAVKDSRIVIESAGIVNDKYITYKTGNPPLYLYDVKTDSVHQISFDEAKNFLVDIGPTSPDGYTISYKHGNYGIFELFGSGNNRSGYVIEKGNASKKLKGLMGDSYNYYNNNFNLLGWVK